MVDVVSYQQISQCVQCQYLEEIVLFGDVIGQLVYYCKVSDVQVLDVEYMLYV